MGAGCQTAARGGMTNEGWRTSAAPNFAKAQLASSLLGAATSITSPVSICNTKPLSLPHDIRAIPERSIISIVGWSSALNSLSRAAISAAASWCSLVHFCERTRLTSGCSEPLGGGSSVLIKSCARGSLILHVLRRKVVTDEVVEHPVISIPFFTLIRLVDIIARLPKLDRHPSSHLECDLFAGVSRPYRRTTG